MRGSEKIIHDLLAQAGVVINGPAPSDIQIKNERVYDRIMSGGTLAVGESYMDGWWEVDDMATMFQKVISAKVQRSFPINFEMLWYVVRARLTNLQSIARASQVAEAHYDLGNDLYERMLGESMVYTCGYWQGVETLDEAQYQKLDLVCRKIGLKKGDTVLDIGCGFGSFAKYAAEKYGAQVTGISVSKEQIAFAQKYTRGLPVDIRFEDYRTTLGQYDHVVSIGMLEAVGYKNLEEYMKTVARVLKPNGLFLLHTIGSNTSVQVGEPWLSKYIFPNGMLPSIAQIGSSIEQYFVMEDWHNFGPDYDKTLLAWWKNFDAHWPELRSTYGDRFYRMWRYYLLVCAGAFRARHNNLWQIVLSPSGVPGGYTSVR